MTPIGGFYFMESFDFSKDDLNPQLIDVAISLVDRTKLEHPFVTDEDIKDDQGKSFVLPNQVKFQFLEEHIIHPSSEDTYYIFGKIKPQFKGLFLHRTNTFKNELKYVGSSGRYILLNTTEETIKYEEWAGLSGSPVLNQEGKCVGILCSVLEGTKSVFIKPFKEITPLLDTVILQERIKDA
jgi:hypothetical protein